MNPKDNGNDGPFPKSVFPDSVFPRRVFPWMGGDEEEQDDEGQDQMEKTKKTGSDERYHVYQDLPGT